MTTTLGYDDVGASAGTIPHGSQAAGYSTGSGEVPWTDADWAMFPGAVRICQDPGATDTTADVLDVESMAATNADAAPWYRSALAHYHAGSRPGQRLPCLYTSAGNVTPLVNQLLADGVQSGPFLWVAHWGIGQPSAEAILNASGGPFPITGVQFADGQMMGTSYDWDVWLSDWLSTVSGPAPVPVPTPPPVPVPPGPVPPARRNVLTPVTVDGDFGPLTCKAQQFVDFGGNLALCDGVFGYHSKIAMQIHLGMVPDGVIGPVTTKALQNRVGAFPDGRWGPLTTAALQRALNAGTY